MSRARATDALLLGLVLALGFFLRRPALALPHDRGDQLIWAGVSRNIAARGADGYTVRGLEPVYAPLGGGAAVVSFACVAPPGPLLEQFKAEGEKYWDAPLVNQPPGFFGILLASHALVGGSEDGFPLLARDPRAFAAARAEFVERYQAGYERRLGEIAALPEGERDSARRELDEQVFKAQGQWERELVRRLRAAPPRGAVRLQLWATLPVLLADLATLALVFVAARVLGGRWAALIAGLAWATDPLALYCSARLLSNAPLATACAIALLLEALAAQRKGPALAALVGAACAAAIAIKVSAVFLLPAVIGGRLLRRDSWRDLAVLAGVASLLAIPWWLLQWRVLGHPFGFAWRRQADLTVASHWAALVASRGVGYYVGSLLHSPLVPLGAVAGAFAWRRHATELAFALAVIGAAMTFEHKEARHLLLAYPPLVVLASAGVVRVASRQRLLVAGACVLLAALFAWQASQGLELALDPSQAP